MGQWMIVCNSIPYLGKSLKQPAENGRGEQDAEYRAVDVRHWEQSPRSGVGSLKSGEEIGMTFYIGASPRIVILQPHPAHPRPVRDRCVDRPALPSQERAAPAFLAAESVITGTTASSEREHLDLRYLAACDKIAQTKNGNKTLHKARPFRGRAGQGPERG